MTIEIKIPDIGGATDVDIIEVMVKPGDSIEVDDSLITLESDKASMEIPATIAGTVAKVQCKVGDKVSEGDVFLIMELAEQAETVNTPIAESKTAEIATEVESTVAESESEETVAKSMDLVIPDIGDAKDVDVIEVMLNVGDTIEKDQSVITLEGDKATMEIPSSVAGVIESITVKVGDKVNQGDVIAKIMGQQVVAKVADSAVKAVQSDSQQQSQTQTKAQTATKPVQAVNFDDAKVYAGPAVRRFARELGVDLTKVSGSGRKGRVTKEDVQSFVKKALASPQSYSPGIGLPPAPVIDFSKFGEIEAMPLNKIKRLTAQNMQRSWLTVPHVTQFDQADVTELEAFRKANKQRAEKDGYKLTVLAFVVKAVANALARFPQFNASLDASGDSLILKKYFNIGIAVDTPNGLVVPVIKNCDSLSVADIAREMARLSVKARDKGLGMQDMSGGCFTISSLGGIGGTAFTPIVNHPEVAILGLSRNQTQPVWQDGQWLPRVMLPMSLSYDHRVIDGAEAARFSAYLSQLLSDIRTLLL